MDHPLRPSLGTAQYENIGRVKRADFCACNLPGNSMSFVNANGKYFTGWTVSGMHS